MATVRDQAERISRCRLSFQIKQGTRTGLVNQHILDTKMFIEDGRNRTGPPVCRKGGTVESFFDELKKHPVPVEEAAVRQIANNSMALDVYCWLAYRLHSLSKSTPISWAAVHGQFGAGFRLVRQIKPTFIEALNLALAVYPEARVDMEKQGLVLHPSPPAVPKAEAKRLGLG